MDLEIQSSILLKNIIEIKEIKTKRKTKIKICTIAYIKHV